MGASTKIAGAVLAAALAAHVWAAGNRDIVFDCPCSAELTVSEDGWKPGVLTLTGGIRSFRAVESGELKLSFYRTPWETTIGAAPAKGKFAVSRTWTLLPYMMPTPDKPMKLRLKEDVGARLRLEEDVGVQLRLDELVLWPAPGEDADASPRRFVDILTDSDGDGVGDVNEQLAGTSWTDPASVPGVSVIDVLPLYTAAFSEAENGFPHTRLLHNMIVTNAFFEDGGANLRLRTVGMGEVGLNQHGWALSDQRKALMDAHGADLTVLFNPRNETTDPCRGAGGCAYVGDVLWRDGRAWVGQHSATTAAHELGHVMGLAHSARQGESYGAFRWSRGHYFNLHGAPSRHGTIMSYGSPWLTLAFSDPSADCGKLGPCGVARHEWNGADAVGSLNLIRFQVAAHRPPQPDSDGDGFVDVADAVPNDSGDWLDSDGDGVGDNVDAFPLDPSKWTDNAPASGPSPFRDPALRAAVADALGKTPDEPILTAELAGLSKLDARGRGVRDLAGLEQATALRVLHLSDNNVSDLSPLAGLAELWSLDVDGNPVSDLSPLARLSLLSLDVSDTKVDFNDMAAMPFLQHLVILEVSGLGVSDLSPLAESSGLKGLNAKNNDIHDLSPLSKLTSFVSLSLSSNRISDISPLSNMTRLHHLRLDDNRISDISPLSNMTRLHRLRLDDNRIVDVSPLVNRVVFGGVASAGSFVDLRGNLLPNQSATEHVETLRAWGIQVWADLAAPDAVRISDPTLRAVLATSFSDPYTAVDDAIRRKGMERVGTVHISGHDVTNLDGLSFARNLKLLSAASNRIVDLSPLAELSELRSLNLRGNRIRDIAPLAANLDLSMGDWVALDGNPLNEDSLNVHVPALLARGVEVEVDPVLLTLAAGGAPLRFDVSGYFTARFGSAAGLTAASGNPLVAAAAMEGATLVATPSRTAGEAMLRVALDAERGLDFQAVVRGPTTVPFMAAEDRHGHGFLRVVNHDAAAGEIRLTAWDRMGRRRPAATLAIGPGEAVHLNAADLRAGNPDKGLAGGFGRWASGLRLALSTNLEIEAAALLRTKDGFLSQIQDIAPARNGRLRVPLLAAGGSDGLLRLANLSDVDRTATIIGVDDAGRLSDAAMTVEAPARATLDIGAAALEAGLGANAEGRWRLAIEPAEAFAAAGFSAGPNGRLSNLSPAPSPALRNGDVHTIPLFLSASDGPRSVLRIANNSDGDVEVQGTAYDNAGETRGLPSIPVAAGAAAHVNAADLGLPAGEWRLALRGEADIEARSYVLSDDGMAMPMHVVAPRTGRRHEVAMFNPGANVRQESLLRIVNPGPQPVFVVIAGIDDAGGASAHPVRGWVPAGGALTATAAKLESGDLPWISAQGRLGDGKGKWRLVVDCGEPVFVMGLLRTSTGHLANLSAAGAR